MHFDAGPRALFAAKPLIFLAPERRPDGVQRKAPGSYLSLLGRGGFPPSTLNELRDSHVLRDRSH